MANRRELKKGIRFVCDELSANAFFCMLLLRQEGDERGDDILPRIRVMQADYLSRVGSCGGKDPKLVRAYFNALRKSFHLESNAILKDIREIVTL